MALWLLRFRAAVPASRPFSPPFWPLPILFVVWANVDGWFLLGLAVAALVWLGQAFDQLREGSAGKGGNGGRNFVPLALRLLVGISALAAACLLNPHHLFAFVPSGWSVGAGPSPSPFQAAYFAGQGFSAAGLAYFPLLGLGLASFLLNLPRWHWQRFLPWMGLALASVFQARAVPFFAIAAGPVLAWNLHEILAARPAARRPARPAGRWQIALGRAAAAVAGLAILVAAWPGFFQAPPYQPRRWDIETPPSLEQGAAAVADWRAHGKLAPGARGLHLSPESADAFAWFCPDDKGLLDRRLASVVLGEPGAPEDWPARMRAEGVSHVIVYNRNHGELFTAVGRLLVDPLQWPLLYEERDLAVFGWRDPERAEASDPFAGMEVDLDRLAFHPAPNKMAPPAPPNRAAEDAPWWEPFWKPAPPRPIDREEAALRLFHAEALRQSVGPRQLAGWLGAQTAALVGASGGWSGPADCFDARVRLTLVVTPPPPAGASLEGVPVPERWAPLFMRAYAYEQNDAPPALLYLAIRAARRALAANPDDAGAYELLGESYLRLLHHTRERAWARRLPQLPQLRYAQASFALNRAVALRPNYAKARLTLGRLYLEMNCLDLAIEQLRAYLKLPHEADDTEATNAEEVDRLAKEAADREEAYTLQSAGARVGERALLAADKGLAAKARDMLLESDVSAFGKAGTELELELLLTTGRPKDVCEWTGPDQEALLEDSNAYHWLRARALAATGNYALSQEELGRMAPSSAADDSGTAPQDERTAMAVVIAGQMAKEASAAAWPHSLRRVFDRMSFLMGVRSLALELRRQANVLVLRGLLALEQGDEEEATFAFHKALDLGRDDAKGPDMGLDFEGRVVAKTCLEWLEK